MMEVGGRVEEDPRDGREQRPGKSKGENKIFWLVWGRTRKEQKLAKANLGKTLKKKVALFSAVRRELRIHSME